MKKLIYFLLIMLLLSLFGCSERLTATSENEMLEIIIRKLKSNDIVQIIDTIELDTAVLIVYMTGEFQAHTYGYAEFTKQENNYKYWRISPMTQMTTRSADLGYFMYTGGSYIFVSNNENNSSLRLRFQGNEELIQIDEIPFVYFWESAPSAFEYHFLDENANELSP
jgi:hypothetical protein